MMLLKDVSDGEKLRETLAKCSGDVILRSVDERE